MAGDIAVNMVGQNSLSPAVSQAVGSFGQLNSAIDQHIGRLVAETRAQAAFSRMMSETHTEQQRGIQVSSRGQTAIQQLVFAVDDAAASYGTGGLSGAIRGAANNITMAASMMGPWGAAIGVGVMAATQLGMALSKTGEEAGKSTGLLDEFRKKVEAIEKSANRIGQGRGSISLGGMGVADAEIKAQELREESQRMEAERMFLFNEEQKIRDEAAKYVRDRTDISNPTMPVDKMTDTDRQHVAQMLSEADRMKERQRDIQWDMGFVHRDERKVRNAIPGLRDRELADIGAQQQQNDIESERRARSRSAEAREMARSLRQELAKGDLNPQRAAEGRKSEIADQLLQRESEINAMGITDEGLRSRMLADAQSVAVQQMTRIDKDRGLGLSARGPATLRSGEAETLRFLNQARLGAASKSSEAKELEKLNQTNREMLSAIREQKQAEENAPVVVVDF